MANYFIIFSSHVSEISPRQNRIKKIRNNIKNNVFGMSLHLYNFQLNAGVAVTLQAQREYPPDNQCKDKFLLQSTIVTPDTDVDELPQDTVRVVLSKV